MRMTHKVSSVRCEMSGCRKGDRGVLPPSPLAIARYGVTEVAVKGGPSLFWAFLAFFSLFPRIQLISA